MFSCNSNNGFANFFQSCKQLPTKLKKIGDYMYHYDCQIGKGTYSTVYSGLCIQNKKPVAIKVVDLQMVKQKNLSSLLFQQTELLSQLNHPNVIKCFALLKSQNRCYIIMELCKDYNLEILMQRSKSKKLPTSEIERIIYDIFQGLQYLSHRSIIHRDIKSANILFSQSGKAKIADFGFATHGLSEFQDNIFVGTPLYMSPQAIIQQKYGPKTDIWSFGVIIHEMIFGHAPLSSCKNQDELLSRIVKPIQISPNQNISPALVQLIQGCLQPNSYQRWTIEKLSKCSYIQGLKRKYYIQSNNFEPIRLGESTANSSVESQSIISKYLNSLNRDNVADTSSKVRHMYTDIEASKKVLHLGNSPNNLKSYQSLQNSDLHKHILHPYPSLTKKQSAPPKQQSVGSRRIQTDVAVKVRIAERNSFGGFQGQPQNRFQYNQRVQSSSGVSNGGGDIQILTQKRSQRQYSHNGDIQQSLKLTVKTVEQTNSYLNLKKANSNQESRTIVHKQSTQFQRRSQMMPQINPFKGRSTFSIIRGRDVSYKQAVCIIHYCRLLYRILQFPRYFNNYLKKWLMFLIKDLKQNTQIHTMKESHSKSLQSVLNGYYSQYSKDYNCDLQSKQFAPQIKSVAKILKSLLEIDQQNKDKSSQKQLLSHLFIETQKLSQILANEKSLQNYTKQSKCQLYLDWYNSKDQKSQPKSLKIKQK